MKKLLDYLSLYYQSVPGRLRRRRVLLWIFFIVTTIFMAIGVTKNNFDMTLDSWFAEDDPIKMSLNNFRDEFGSDDGIFIVYRPKDGDILSEPSLKAVQGIRRELLDLRQNATATTNPNLKRITRIDNILSANVLKVEDDALVSKKFIGNQLPRTHQEREVIRKEAQKQRAFKRLYFSDDFRYGGISIETDLGTIVKTDDPSDGFPLEQTETEDAETSGFEESDGFEEVDMEVSMEVDESALVEKTEFAPVELDDYLGLMEEIDQVLNKPEYADHLEYYPVGNAPLMQIMMEMMEEMGPLYMGMLLIMIILLWALFKSLASVVWPLLIVILSTVWTLGIFGWFGTTITNMVSLTVVLVLAVGVADSIHILSGYLHFRNQGENHQKALDSAFLKSALPCLLTAMTTMVGMLALTVTPISHIKVFGFSSAVGVGMAFFFTIYLLPLMLDLWSPVKSESAKPSTDLKGIRKAFKSIANGTKRVFSPIDRLIPDSAKLLQPLLEKTLPWVEKRPTKIILFFLSLFIVCVYGATQVKIDSNMADATREGHRLRIIYDTVDGYMMGSQNMEIMIDMGTENALQDPKVLMAIEQFQTKLETDYKTYVVKTSSLADVVKDAYQVLNEDREEMYKIPEDSRMLTQTLFMFNNANPEDRRKLVSDDYSKSHISVQLYNNGSYEFTRFFKDVQEDLKATMAPLRKDYPSMSPTVTGGLALIMELADYISKTQIRSLGLAILIISCILIFLLGSFRVGFLSILPNLIPATLTFGALGLLDMPLDSDTIIIAPVIIGIAVDDTIHFITHYRGEVIKHRDIPRALRNTLSEVGQAITFTSIILGLGFSIMAFSSYMSLVKVGIFGSFAIFVALACDLFLLPALMLKFKPKFLSREEKAALELAQNQTS